MSEHLADGGTRHSRSTRQLSAYFNIDNGTGKIRGIWMQQNYGVPPIFRQWIEPLNDLGVTTLAAALRDAARITSRSTRSGIPGFQFIQERLEYNSRTHHSNMDMVDHVQREDMMQMATVVAWFAYNTAMRDEKLPRKAPSEVIPDPSSLISGRTVIPSIP